MCVWVPGVGSNLCETHSECISRLEDHFWNFFGFPSNASSGTSAQSKSIGTESPIEVVVFQDLKCGMCKYWHQEIYPIIQRELISTGRIKLTFKEYPLIPRRTEMTLAIGAKCAAQQGQYHPYLSVVYKNMKEINEENLISLMKGLDINTDDFHRCLVDPQSRELVQKDILAGRELEVPGTPAFLMNGEIHPGANALLPLLERK